MKLPKAEELRKELDKEINKLKKRRVKHDKEVIQAYENEFSKSKYIKV